MTCLRAAALLAALLALAAPAGAELRGHGGPVRALAVAPDGATALSGAFDARAILWDLASGTARRVLQLHDGSVNAVAALPGGGWATAGEDGRIAVWPADGSAPLRVEAAHQGPIVGLAVSPDGHWLGSASWDGTARLTRIAPPPASAGGGGDAPRALAGHSGPVNAIGFLADGRPVTAGYDATLRIWPAAGEAPVSDPERTFTLAGPQNALAVARDGQIAVAGADGVIRLLGADGTPAGEVTGDGRPVIALALSPDQRLLAAATIGGTVTVLEREGPAKLYALEGPGLPVWSVAFAADGQALLTGGGDRAVRRWSAEGGGHLGPIDQGAEGDPLAALGDHPGARVFRACAACHTLGPDDGARAGPTLHGIFGRRIASLPDYPYSEALRRLDIVWTPETVAELFTAGPAAYTPGTKMPEQRITDPAQRRALIEFLEERTR